MAGMSEKTQKRIGTVIAGVGIAVLVLGIFDVVFKFSGSWNLAEVGDVLVIVGLLLRLPRRARDQR